MHGFDKIHPSQVLDMKGFLSNQTYRDNQLKRQPSEKHISCMLKVTSGVLAGIWLPGPPPTLLVSNQQCGQSPAVDGNNSLCIRKQVQTALSSCHMKYISSFCEVSGGAPKKSRQKSNLENSPHKVGVSVLMDSFFTQCT